MRRGCLMVMKHNLRRRILEIDEVVGIHRVGCIEMRAVINIEREFGGLDSAEVKPVRILEPELEMVELPITLGAIDDDRVVAAIPVSGVIRIELHAKAVAKARKQQFCLLSGSSATNQKCADEKDTCGIC